MNNKDKKQLKGMASLMPSVVQIGKDGLSDAVIDSARAAITARELIKAHVLNNANLPTKETMEDLADMLGAELIQVIGHYGVLFKKKDKKSFHIIIWLLSGLCHIWLFPPLFLLCTMISCCKVTKNRR